MLSEILLLIEFVVMLQNEQQDGSYMVQRWLLTFLNKVVLVDHIVSGIGGKGCQSDRCLAILYGRSGRCLAILYYLYQR